MNRSFFIKLVFINIIVLFCASSVKAQDKLLEILSKEVNTYYKELQGEKIPPYFLSCRVDDVKTTIVDASFGVINSVSQNRVVAALPEVRIGTRDFDNFHNNTPGTTMSYFSSPEPIMLPYSVTGGEAAVKQILWREFTSRYKYGLSKYQEMRSSKGVRTEESDRSPDFTSVNISEYQEPPFDYQKQELDIEKSKELAKKYSAEFLKYPNIIRGSVIIRQELIRKYFVSTEGAKISHNLTHNFLMIRASVKAEDGMDLPLAITYFAFDQKDFPAGSKVEEDIKDLSARLNRLRVAPLVQPFTGPALLSGSTSGVFFHEIFGHRIEGQKMKSDGDGQTFKKMIGNLVLPSSISVYDDPSLSNYKGQELNGYYRYDDQGVSGRRVTVVKNGILNDFLMTRTSIEGFPESNGHARAEVGYDPTSRQSNLIVETGDPKSDEELKTMLREEAKRQGKEYGFYFKEVTGGFTMTGRSSPNAFNVTPLEVYRIYVDGREDELVRGVDMIGTPLSMFSNIVCAGGSIESFIGSCGSISGYVPVSAISPAILVSKVELQMKPKSGNLPPILARP
ncbi:MAG: metallopeptidase TldD-related protein [Bacteroidales bacterium]|jgi:predicted Zn-dependent protease